MVLQLPVGTHCQNPDVTSQLEVMKTCALLAKAIICRENLADPASHMLVPKVKSCMFSV